MTEPQNTEVSQRTACTLPEPAPDQPPKKRRRMLMVLWSALAVWTILLSVGTSLYAPAPGAGKAPSVDWRRGLLVFAFVGGFLGLWMWLATRQRTPRGLGDGLAITGDRTDGVQSRQQQGGEQGQEDE